MKTETIIPESEKAWLQFRTKDVTSSEVAALFKCCPYLTLFELWHRKKNPDIKGFEGNEFTRLGLAMERPIACHIADREGFIIRKMDEYIRVPSLRIGSSFDYAIMDKNFPGAYNGNTKELCIYNKGEKLGPKDVAILEIKNVFGMKFKEDWVDEGGQIEAPPHIELQVQHQLLVSGLEKAYIGALVGGNAIKLIERGRNETVIKAIRSKVSAFWKTIDEEKEPEPNFEEDAKFISQLYGYAEPEKSVEVNGEMTRLAENYRSYGQVERDAYKKKEAIKAKILMAIGDAERASGDLFTISAKMVGPTKISYERKGYRGFRIAWKKGGGDNGQAANKERTNGEKKND